MWILLATVVSILTVGRIYTKLCRPGNFLFGTECRPCPPNCAACSLAPSLTCHSCKVGYYGKECTLRCSEGCYHQECYQFYGYCQHGCLNGYYGGHCSRCPDTCTTCLSSKYCTSCKLGYYGGRCDRRRRNCKDSGCSMNGNCTGGCTHGSYQENTSCILCPGNCFKCTSGSDCDQCKTGFFGTKCEQQCRYCRNNTCSINGICKDGCTDGFYQGTTTGCEACPDSCSKCTNDSVCFQCKIGFFGAKCDQPCHNCINNRCSINGFCKDGCTDGFYQGTTGCEACPGNCSKCRSDSVCDECSPGYYGRTCSFVCPDTCHTCTPVRDCLECNGSNDQQCDHNCSKTCFNSCSMTDGECFRCIQGYYKVKGRCLPCMRGCAKCRDLGVCIKCLDGYYRVRGTNKCHYAGDEETVQELDVLRSVIIPVVCMIVGILLTVSVRCVVVKWRRRTGDGPPKQGALYITAQPDSTSSNTYAEVYSGGDLSDTPNKKAIYITAHSDSPPSNKYAEVYSGGDLTETVTKGDLYITAQSDAAPSNINAEVHLDGDLTDTPTCPSPAEMTRRLLTTVVSMSESDRETSGLYASIDEANTDTGARCGHDQTPRSLCPGVGPSSERDDQLPRTLYPRPLPTVPGLGAVSSMVRTPIRESPAE